MSALWKQDHGGKLRKLWHRSGKRNVKPINSENKKRNVINFSKPWVVFMSLLYLFFSKRKNWFTRTESGDKSDP